MNALECKVDARREAVRAAEGWNGLDFVEVDNAQTTLTVYFLGKAPYGITRDNLVLTGGRSERDAVRILSIDVQPSNVPEYDDRMLVRVDRPGDFSDYKLQLTGLEKIDPRYGSLEFSFKAGCPTDLDCAAACGCPPAVHPSPDIDYLAKDYAGFRQLIFDRLALICPDWQERHVPDLGVALVELLAYIGDYLSYYQDAVATEAYLDTARRRPSVRRHVRLVAYTLGEGSNARALVVIQVVNNIVLNASNIYFVSGVPSALPEVAGRAAVVEHELARLSPDTYIVFEPLQQQGDIALWTANNRFTFYTWSDRECCLKKGATRATLNGQLAQEYGEGTHLRAGDLLIFGEVMGPVTGADADADPRHRHAVRLTKVTAGRDDLLDRDVIEIEWGAEDALPFDLCLTALGGAPECHYLEDVTIAWGNVVAVDQGRRVGPEDLGQVPTASSELCCECEGQPSEVRTVPGRFYPQLKQGPLTFRASWSETESAARLLSPNTAAASPQVTVSSDDQAWTAQADLLEASGDSPLFVVEMEESGVANLRFGNGELGAPLIAGTTLKASYRVGNGKAGNVGAGAITLLVDRASQLSNDIESVRNPLAASGGTAPEPMAEAKLNAPSAFRSGDAALQRAITPEDYARIAERQPGIQRAAGRFLWTGSWYEAAVALDPHASHAAGAAALVDTVEDYLESFRRIGHDLDVRLAEHVPVDLQLAVCVQPQYLRGHVKAALLQAFGNRTTRGGSGFFHPDRLTFGDDIYLSQIVAAAQAVPGVASVQVTRLRRQRQPSNHEIENGVLPLGAFEIAQLDNDPNYPDRGALEIRVAGGR